jgi:hypothetical protein
MNPDRALSCVKKLLRVAKAPSSSPEAEKHPETSMRNGALQPTC